MVLRPLDASGDILPILESDDTLTGAAAIARLAAHRLQLLAGEWWENPHHGNVKRFQPAEFHRSRALSEIHFMGQIK